MSLFRFQQFDVTQSRSAMKVGTDAVVLGSLINAEDAASALEIGSGTGVISLMLAQRFPQLSITAIEIDAPSADDCKENFHQSQWSERLTLIEGDFVTAQWDQKFDLIFSNPPFYKNSLLNPDDRKARSRHESFLPLDLLLKKGNELLTERGQIWLINPDTSTPELVRFASSVGLYLSMDITVQGRPGRSVRSVLAFKSLPPQELSKQFFCIRDVDGSYSNEYKALTKDFHNREI